MTRRYRSASIAALALLAGACGGPKASRAPVPGEPIALTFQDAEVPGVLDREALARRDRAKGAQGLWAAVPGLRRPERGLVVNLDTGASVTVALFSGNGPATEIRLSNAAAELIGIGADPERVRVTAVRREPVIVAQ